MHSRQRHHTHSNNLGFNLIEAALVLGVVGLIIGGIFAAWGTVSSQQRVRKAAEMTTTIVAQIRSAYASRTTFDATDVANAGQVFTNALIAANLIPADLVVSGYVKNPWNGNILVSPDASGMNIVFDNINLADCKKLTSNVLGSGRTQGLTKVAGNAVTASSTFSSLPASVCSGNTVSFYFLLKTN